MIRPRRTFQDRQSSARWDKIRQANRSPSYVRVSLLVTFLLVLILLAIRTPRQQTSVPETPSSLIDKPAHNSEIQEKVTEEPFSDDFHFVLGANEANEVVKGDDNVNIAEMEAHPPDRHTNSFGVNNPDHDIEHGNLGHEVEVDEINVEHQEPLNNQEPPHPDSSFLDQEHDSESSHQDEFAEADAESEFEKEAISTNHISVDGTVGNPDIGGTYDGTDVILYPQITLPEQPIIQHYDSSQNYWPLHSILKQRGWAYATMALPSRVTLWISRGAVPPRLKMGYQMLNSIGVSGCIGGTKSLQLECRKRLARIHGCEYDSLKIQPPQYNMQNLDDCKRFFADAEKPERMNQVYVSKPVFSFHGAGIRVHQGAQGSLRHEFGACKSPKNTILMDYIAKPATMMGGFKFDFRTYILVASLKPQLVFYHDGFVRKSDRVFDLHSKDLNVHITNKITQSKDEHFFNFTKLGYELHRELGLPKDHLDTYVRPRAKAVSRFLFQTALVQPQPPRHVPGRFHVFGIDWLLDASGKLHLLEGNGYPLVTYYPGIGLTPRIWEEMMDLVLAIQTKPATLTKKLTVKDNFEFGGWKLVFNELEEMMERAKGTSYNACKAFQGSS